MLQQRETDRDRQTETDRQRQTETDRKLRSCVKVEVDVLGSPSLTFRTVSVNVKQH